jgi:hypothetical protein
MKLMKKHEDQIDKTPESYYASLKNELKSINIKSVNIWCRDITKWKENISILWDRWAIYVYNSCINSKVMW